MRTHSQNMILNEQLSRLDTKFLLIDHGLCPDWKRKEHIRMRDTMYLILDGEGKITINGKTYFPRKNDLVLLPRNSRVSLYAEPETCYNKYWCDFIMNLDGHSFFELIQIPYLIHLDDITVAKSLFDHLDELHLKTDIASALMIKSALLQLIALFLSNGGSPAPYSGNNDDFTKLLNTLIKEHLQEKLSVKFLADATGYNEKYFISLFKRHFHMTPAQYVKYVRLEQAKYELLYTDKRAAMIIDKIGYSTVQKFSADFKTHTGYSPMEFKKSFQ